MKFIKKVLGLFSFFKSAGWVVRDESGAPRLFIDNDLNIVELEDSTKRIKGGT